MFWLFLFLLILDCAVVLVLFNLSIIILMGDLFRFACVFLNWIYQNYILLYYSI